MVSECGRARSREDGRCSWSYYAAAAAAGREESRWVEVVEARFWLVLALPVRTWLALAFDGYKGYARQASHAWRKTGTRVAGRQRCNRLGDILNSGVVHICKAADTAIVLHYHRCYSACMTQIPQLLNIICSKC